MTPPPPPKQSNRYRLFFVLFFNFLLYTFFLEWTSFNTILIPFLKIQFHCNSQLTNIRPLLLVTSSQTHNRIFSEPGSPHQNGRIYHRHHRHQLKRLCSRPPLSVPAKEPQKTSNTRSLVPKKKKRKYYAKDSVGKYAHYFEKDKILPIPQLVEAVEPKTLSFVISDLRTRDS